MKKDFLQIISMMSGTSMDGTDACLIKVFDDDTFEIVDSYSLEYPPELRNAVMKAALNKASVKEVCALNFLVGEHFALCTNKLLEKANISPENVDFISSHGQTIFHMPDPVELGGLKTGSTLQIGDISVIAYKTGILTIGDFRPKDIAAKGQGAPLVPFADEIIFGRKTPRCIQNIGGISNVTVLSPDFETFAFDNAPGNMLIDYYVKKFFEMPFDKDGKIANSGKTDEKFLQKLSAEPYYAKKPPKSTGRELFNDEYAEKMLEFAPKNPADIVKTATELTAKTIFDSYRNFVFDKVTPECVVIGGGGALNPTLMSLLQQYFGKIPVKTHADFNVPDKLKEAAAFALIGKYTFLKKPSNVPSCTGAEKAVILGKIAYPD